MRKYESVTPSRRDGATIPDASSSFMVTIMEWPSEVSSKVKADYGNKSNEIILRFQESRLYPVIMGQPMCSSVIDMIELLISGIGGFINMDQILLIDSRGGMVV